MKSSKEVAELIKNYIEGTISSEENIQLNNWIKEDPEHEVFFKKLLTEDELFEDAFTWIDLKQQEEETWLQELKDDTISKILDKQVTQLRPKSRTWLYYAAALILTVGFSFLLFQNRQNQLLERDADLASILPGSNKAELVLSNGKKINLRNDKNGIIIDETLEYSDGTPLLSIDKKNLSKMSATIHVPKGGKYQITLPDGTKVWLNSMSKLEYPLAFTNEKRSVKIEGEAYFEVAKLTYKNKRVPFEVVSKTQTIEVTGTQFNISAYQEDPEAVCTLVEGSVNIHTSNGNISLVPNQQAINKSGSLTKKDVDVSSFVAWKNNKFLFYETELKDVMKGLSRWYDIQISYQGNIPDTYFYGEIGRDKNLAEVLRIMEKSGVKFKLRQIGTEKKLIVIP